MKTRFLFLVLCILFLGACSSDSNDNSNSTAGENMGGDTNITSWSIPVDEVFDGGSGVDGIPSIQNPTFVESNSNIAINYLSDEDLVIGILVDGEARAYPHRILDWHEIINDNVNGEKITINYCPLTGSAMAWESIVDGKETTFGVSGLLYNSNLILFDRETGSRWSQMTIECVNGDLIGDKPKLIPIIETDWGTWKKLHPNTKVLSDSQGFDRVYSAYPYGTYLEQDDFLLFPVSPLNTSRMLKERVLAIVENNITRTFPIQSFTGGLSKKRLFGNKNILIIGNENIVTSFEIPTNLQNANFVYAYTNGETFFQDDLGNEWNIHGFAISGPNQGIQLQQPKSFMSFWFAIAAFYPNLSVD